MRFSMIFEMVDRLTGPVRRARAGVAGLASTTRSMAQRVRQAAGELRRGERSLSGFARTARRAARVSLGQMFEHAVRRARQLDRNLASLVVRLRLVERAGFATGRALRRMAGMAGGLLKTGLLGGGAALAGAGGFALFDLFRTAGQFEQYQVQLEGIEGSAAAARKAMAWVQEFTAKTPFELGQVMEGFVALKAYPSYDEAVAVRDSIAGRLDRLALAAADRGDDDAAGAFDRLRLALARDISVRGASLARIYQLRLSASEPALVLAHRLYGGDNDRRSREAVTLEERAETVVARNRIAHPSFVPAGVDIELLTTAPETGARAA